MITLLTHFSAGVEGRGGGGEGHFLEKVTGLRHILGLIFWI